MVSRSVWQVNIDHYLVDTAHLTTVEHGAYMLLLMHYWKHGGLPADEAHIRRITRLNTPTWRRLRPALAAFFDADWKHKRVEKDLLNYTRFVRKQTNNSRARFKKRPVENPPFINGVASVPRIGVNPLTKQGVDSSTGPSMDHPPLRKKDILSYRARPAVEKGHPSKQEKQARQAWENELLHWLGPPGFADAMELLIANPSVMQDATNAELEKSGEGWHVAVRALKGLV